MAILQPDQVIVGGYSMEDQQPNPFIALEFHDLDQLKQTSEQMKSRIDSPSIPFQLTIRVSDSDELRVTLEDRKTREIWIDEECWKDEMWEIFRAYYARQEKVWVMLSHEGEVEKEPLFTLDAAAVLIDRSLR